MSKKIILTLKKRKKVLFLHDKQLELSKNNVQRKIPNFNKIEIINVHLQMINNANYPIVYDFFVVCAKQIITS